MIKFKLLKKHLFCNDKKNECEVLHPQTDSDQVLMVSDGQVSNKTLTESFSEIENTNPKHEVIATFETIDVSNGFDIGEDKKNKIYVYYNSSITNGTACITIENINEYFGHNKLDSISIPSSDLGKGFTLIDSLSTLDNQQVILSEYSQADFNTCKDSGYSDEVKRIRYAVGIQCPVNNFWCTNIYRYSSGTLVYFVVDYGKKADSLTDE